jgi:orotate phosphoribosyltransferase
MKHARTIAALLLKERAVFLRPQDPFTWTSGIRSPVYCDNRLLISTVEAREQVVGAFVEAVRELKVDLIAGTATAGIPWAAFIAQELRLPMVYVRSSSKEHGRQNAIEGKAPEGARAVLIEDLISTGKSSIAAAQRLQESGIQVDRVQSIFTYAFPQAEQVFDLAGIKHQSLTTFEVLSQVAYDERLLDDQALKQVLDWRKSVRFP